MDDALGSRVYTAWQLTKLYWQSEQRTIATLFLITVLILTLLIVGLEVAINHWYNYFYDALQAYDKNSTIHLLFIFMGLAAAFIVLGIQRYYLQQLLGLRWRRWLTQQFLHRWLDHRIYYYLENFDDKTDNPDQRIQED